jgi:hypothetical protein
MDTIRTMLTGWVAAVLVLLAVGAIAAESPAVARLPTAGPLKVHPQNPRYFTDGSGKAVLLTGSHTWPSLVDMGAADPPSPFDFAAYLDFIEKFGHNFVRLWTWETTTSGQHVTASREQKIQYAAPMPYARTGPGNALDDKPKYDLAKFNPEYFERLRSRVAAARDRGIYVSIMLFEGYGVQFYKNAWQGHPFNGANNVNGIEADANGDGMGVEVHELGNPRVTAVQEAYVRKVIDTVNDLDNVLYEISNENHPPSTEWQYHMIRFIHEYEKGKPRQHPVGMTFQYKGGSNQPLFDSPAEWVSPNPQAPGGYDYRKNPPPSDGRKVVLSDTDHLWGIGGDVAWVWKSFLRGHNPIFMDPYRRPMEGNPGGASWDPVRRNLGYVLRYARRMNLAAMPPQGKLASTGYCLANPAKERAEYLVYLPDGSRVTVDLSGTQAALAVEWFDPETGNAVAAEPVTGGGSREFTAPLAGPAVLYIAAADRG